MSVLLAAPLCDEPSAKERQNGQAAPPPARGFWTLLLLLRFVQLRQVRPGATAGEGEGGKGTGIATQFSTRLSHKKAELLSRATRPTMINRLSI